LALRQLLVRQAQNDWRKTERGIEVVPPGSNQEMANQLGTVR
jgi:hypothetical protein